jgi:AAA domain
MTAAKRGARPQRRAKAADSRENPQAVEAASVEIDILDPEEYVASINWLLYGPEGNGKTLLAGAAPNAYFISTEPGGPISTLRAGNRPKKIIPAPSWEHALSAVRWADDHLGSDDFVIIDSHTRMQIEYLRWLLRMRHADNDARDLDIPAIQDHQKWQNGFTRWTDHIIAAEYNAIFIATDMIKEITSGPQEGEDIVMPSFTGKNYTIAKYIASQMQVVSYYAVSTRASNDEDGTVRRALFQPYPPFTAKDRYDVFGSYQDVAEKDYTAMADWIGMIQDSNS